MTQQDRSEVREMIHGILSGWEAQTVAREDLISMSLQNIDSHLGKINGKVQEHERIIIKNIPHTIDHCPQDATIKEIRDNMVSGKAVKSAIAWSVGASSCVITVVFLIIKLITGNL